jgi:putative ABC transport system substrate-binding protein
MVISDASHNFTYRKLIVDTADAHGIITVAAYRAFAELGATASLGMDLRQMFGEIGRRLAAVLRGEKPGDIPFFLPTTFELVLNRQSAARIGIEFSSALLARADEVIE